MHPPDEMMTASFLPAMRVLVSESLRKEGMSQGKIAAVLGVTQASVSQYSRSVGRALGLLEGLGVTDEEGRRYASLLAEDLKKSPVYAVNTLLSVWFSLLGQGRLCAPHRSMYPSLSQCDVCMRLRASAGDASGGSVEQVARAVELVEGSTVFVRVMPEVSVNIAQADAGASGAGQVVAVPGRIVRVRGAPRSFTRPEYGASTHLAEMLLEMRARDERLTAAINLRYDERIGMILAELGILTLTLSAPYPGGRDPILEALKLTRGRAGSGFGAVVAPGGEGLEPCLYLFGEGAVGVAQLALKIARACIASA